MWRKGPKPIWVASGASSETWKPSKGCGKKILFWARWDPGKPRASGQGIEIFSSQDLLSGSAQPWSTSSCPAPAEGLAHSSPQEVGQHPVPPGGVYFVFFWVILTDVRLGTEADFWVVPRSANIYADPEVKERNPHPVFLECAYLLGLPSAIQNWIWYENCSRQGRPAN